MARKISDWVMTDCGAGAFRHYEGSDPDFIQNRVAFIEKTPRIRIRPAQTAFDGNDHMNWAERDFKGSGPESIESRAWCDAALKLFGYEV